MSRAHTGASRSSCLLILSTAVLAAAVVEMHSGRPAEAHGQCPSVIDKKTFSRWPDPVVIDVGILRSLLGTKIEELRVYAQRDGSFGPIPFQVDEKDAKGTLILPSGRHPNARDANGLLDKGEELVFMARDSGDRIDTQALPAGVQRWEELVVEDPLTHGKGWVYVLSTASGSLPLSEEDYIFYDPHSHREGEGDFLLHRTKYYECHHYPQEPYFDTSAYPNAGFAHNYYAVTPSGGGTGRNFCDRFKVRVTVAFFFGTVKFHIDENAIMFYENAYKDGPVRLIRNDKLVISLPLRIKAPGAAVNIIWYDTIVNVPLIIDIPFNPGFLYSYLEISLGEDHRKGAIGAKVYNSNNLQGCLVDGKTEGAAETAWDTRRDQWRLITGPEGTLMNRSFWDENYLKQMAGIKVEYLDDIDRPDPPEEESGMLGMIRQTNRVQGIKKARYYSYIEWYYVPRFLFSGPGRTYRVGDEKAYLDIADHPVRVRAGNLTMESHYFGQMPGYEEQAPAAQ